MGKMVCWVRKKHGCMGHLLRKNITEKPIVWPYEEPVAGMNGNCPAIAADARINNTYKGRISGEVGISRGQYPSAGCNVLRRDIVSDINNMCIWRNTGNNAFYYTYIAIAHAKVG